LRIGNVISQVTFNDSPGLTQFKKDTPTYSGMTFDPANDHYLFYCGVNDQAGRVYAAKPNSGGNWDLSILPTSGDVPSAPGSGIHNRFQYVPALKGVVMLPATGRGLFFMRTS
jgi:hypothetical protein